MHKYCLIIFLLFILSSCKSYLKIEEPSSVHGEPQNLFSLVKNHDRVIFYTLKPFPVREAKKHFHNYPIISEVELKLKSHRERLFDNLLRAIERSNGRRALCFLPRHGLRLIKGEEVLDLVICFQCDNADLYGNEQSLIQLTGKSDVFNEVAKELKMTLSKN